MAERLKDMAKKIREDRTRLPLIDISSESDMSQQESIVEQPAEKPESAIRSLMRERTNKTGNTSKKEEIVSTRQETKNAKLSGTFPKYFRTKFPTYK